MLIGFSSPKLTKFTFHGLNEETDVPEEMETYAISSMLNRFQSLEQLVIHLIWIGQWSTQGPKAAAKMGEAIVRHAGPLRMLAYREELYLNFRELERPDTMMNPIKRCTNLEELALWIDSSLDIASICKVKCRET